MKKEETPLYKMIISIHAPHARSDYVHPLYRRYRVISIHAPHARSDARAKLSHHSIQLFQSTLLMRGATSLPTAWRHSRELFQSTLLMRGATGGRQNAGRHRHFNPRSSCEERRIAAAGRSGRVEFQSTLLMRGATSHILSTLRRPIFQSTLLMRGATR